MTTQRNLRGKALEEYKKTLKLTVIQHELIIGTLLGDASMSHRNGRPHYSIKFEQGEKNADYVNHLYEIFSPFTGTPPKYRYIDKKRTRRAIWFRTYSHKQFIPYWNAFYPKNQQPNNSESKKVVPNNIKKYITPRVLAYWFMDDGNITSDRKAFHINTQGFEKHECKRLAQILQDKFNIQTSVHKDKDRWRIYILRQSALAFKALIDPYVLSCFDYCLDLDLDVIQ